MFSRNNSSDIQTHTEVHLTRRLTSLTAAAYIRPISSLLCWFALVAQDDFISPPSSVNFHDNSLQHSDMSLHGLNVDEVL